MLYDNSKRILILISFDDWTVSGKIKKIIREENSGRPDLEFRYDAMGNRIAKIVKPASPTVAITKIFIFE
jgi:hypothetical protein